MSWLTRCTMLQQLQWKAPHPITPGICVNHSVVRIGDALLLHLQRDDKCLLLMVPTIWLQRKRREPFLIFCGQMSPLRCCYVPDWPTVLVVWSKYLLFKLCLRKSTESGLLRRLLVVFVVICFHVAEARSKQMIKNRLAGLGNEYAFLTCPLMDKSPHHKPATRAFAVLERPSNSLSKASQPLLLLECDISSYSQFRRLGIALLGVSFFCSYLTIFFSWRISLCFVVVFCFFVSGFFFPQMYIKNQISFCLSTTW